MKNENGESSVLEETKEIFRYPFYHWFSFKSEMILFTKPVCIWTKGVVKKKYRDRNLHKKSNTFLYYNDLQ